MHFRTTSYLSIVLLISLCACTHGQSSEKLDFSKDIDEQVWHPFKRAYANNDGPLYVSLHTDDVLRITEWGIEEGIDFKTNTLKNFANPNRLPAKIDFVFEHRLHEAEVAYEVGYFELITLEDSKEKDSYYGRFHVVLKKINGVWKIAQDWDTENINGHEIAKRDFDRLK